MQNGLGCPGHLPTTDSEISDIYQTKIGQLLYCLRSTHGAVAEENQKKILTILLCYLRILLKLQPAIPWNPAISHCLVPTSWPSWTSSLIIQPLELPRSSSSMRTVAPVVLQTVLQNQEVLFGRLDLAWNQWRCPSPALSLIHI